MCLAPPDGTLNSRPYMIRDLMFDGMNGEIDNQNCMKFAISQEFPAREHFPPSLLLKAKSPIMPVYPGRVAAPWRRWRLSPGPPTHRKRIFPAPAGCSR